MSFPGFPLPPTPGPGPTPTPSLHNLLSPTHGDTVPGTPGVGDIVVSATGAWEQLAAGAELDHLVIVGGIPQWTAQAGSGLGDVTGPASATDNAVARYDQTTGKLIQNSLVLIDDAGNLSVQGNTTVSGDLTVLGDSNLNTATINNLNVTNNLNVGGDVVNSGTVTNLGDVFTSGNVFNSGNTTLNNLTILGTISSLPLTGAVGDILYATGIDEFGNLGIGSTGEVLTVLAGVPVWAAASGGGGATGGPVQVTLESSATVTITDSDYLVATSGTTTVNLPPTPADGQRHIIKDSLGVASTTPITIDGNGHPIDDAATASLVNNYQALKIIYVNALGQWQLV